MLIAQITDTHILAKDKHWLSEPLTQTSERLAKVVANLNRMNPLPDVVLLTGDTSDTGTPAAYEHLKELLRPLVIPLYVIPGNHDVRHRMREAFAASPYMPREGFIQYVIQDYPVSLIGLDTLVEGEFWGQVEEESFTWLRQVIRENEDKPALIFMHHPPAKIGHRVFDAIRCRVPEAFEEWISTQRYLLGIISGHQHRFCATSYGNKPCFVAPSIAPVHYFAHPDDADATSLELDDPSIMLHHWHGGTTMISHIIRLQEHYRCLDWAEMRKKLHAKI